MGIYAGNRSRPAYSGQPRFQFPRQVIELFKPRSPIEFRAPIRKKKLRPMTGLAGFLDRAFYDDNNNNPKDSEKVSTKEKGGVNKGDSDDREDGFEIPGRRRRRKRQERKRSIQKLVEKRRNEYEKYSGHGDSWKTVFVSGLSPEITEKILWWKMEIYGRVTRVVIPTKTVRLGSVDDDGGGKNELGVEGKEIEMNVGYGFVEYESERGVERAIREGNNRRIGRNRVLVDVERGRTVKDWLPNKLDGPKSAHVIRKRVAAIEPVPHRESYRERDRERFPERSMGRRRMPGLPSRGLRDYGR